MEGGAIPNGRAPPPALPGHDDRIPDGARPAAIRWPTDACAPTSAGIYGRAIATGRATHPAFLGHDDRISEGVRPAAVRRSTEACAPTSAGIYGRANENGEAAQTPRNPLTLL